jgi:tetratricopeptide (TPR) repeat protein
MEAATPFLSDAFRQLYCDAAVFDSFSEFHPISFRRALPFQSPDEAIDKSRLIEAEAAHLAGPTDATRLGVVEEYFRCGLLKEPEAINLRAVLDFFDADFFELMGLAYANAGRFRCALRWYRERIRELERQTPNSCSDWESVYASAGYCLYSLELFEEAIAWSKSCIGPRQMAEVISRALIDYELQLAGGVVRTIERSGSRTRYTIVSDSAPADVGRSVSQIKNAITAFAPFQEIYIDWAIKQTTATVAPAEGYPFKAEFDASSLLRHRMNLIFASCGHADALMERGYNLEAKRVLSEVAMLEPNASFVWERLRLLDPRAVAGL